MTKERQDALDYVGTNELSGNLQLELLKKEGCTPESKVLEVGCGMLNAGYPVMQYLNAGHYVGIEPNQWLIDIAMENAEIKRVAEEKQARFLNVIDFDASPMGMTFDFILSHSILSHAAHWQLRSFLQKTGEVLAPRGRIIASLFLAEGNKWGNPGTPNKDDSKSSEWRYPDCTCFKLSTVMGTAQSCGFDTKVKLEYTQLYVATRPSENHDWLIFWRSE